jgi:hypothetical protein
METGDLNFANDYIDFLSNFEAICDTALARCDTVPLTTKMSYLEYHYCEL